MNYKTIASLVDQINDCNRVLEENPHFGMGKVPKSLHSIVDDGILLIIRKKRDSLLADLAELTKIDIEV